MPVRPHDACPSPRRLSVRTAPICPRDTLGKWHGVVTDFVQSQPDWERFRARTRAHLESMGHTGDDGEYEELALSLPELVDETLRYLGPERVDGVLQEAVDASTQAVKDYLACA